MQINSRVLLQDEGFQKTFMLVESEGCDQGGGRISTVSPLGKALSGRMKNEMVEIEAP